MRYIIEIHTQTLGWSFYAARDNEREANDLMSFLERIRANARIRVESA